MHAQHLDLSAQPSLVCCFFPQNTQTALATMVNFILTAIIGQFFLSMLCSMRYGVFFFFAGRRRVGLG